MSSKPASWLSQDDSPQIVLDCEGCNRAFIAPSVVISQIVECPYCDAQFCAMPAPTEELALDESLHDLIDLTVLPADLPALDAVRSVDIARSRLRPLVIAGVLCLIVISYSLASILF